MVKQWVDLLDMLLECAVQAKGRGIMDIHTIMTSVHLYLSSILYPGDKEAFLLIQEELLIALDLAQNPCQDLEVDLPTCGHLHKEEAAVGLTGVQVYDDSLVGLQISVWRPESGE